MVRGRLTGKRLPMRRRTAALTLVLLAFDSASAFAADQQTATDPPAIVSAVSDAARNTVPSLDLPGPVQPQKRPAAMPILYGTYATLQVMDVISTRKAIAAGSHEANPVMSAGSMGTMLAVKAAGGAATVYFAERAWKRNRAAAIVLMIAVNGATAAIAAHNARNARR
jgi:hypothetical protein